MAELQYIRQTKEQVIYILCAPTVLYNGAHGVCNTNLCSQITGNKRVS
jgi:hypothetical protein